MPLPWNMCLSFSLALLLTVSPPRPIEGNAMTLTCKTQLLTQKLDVPLQFFFFKDGSALGLSWNNSSELQITALKRRDSGSYWCEAQGEGPKVIRSRRIQIVVQGECHWGLCWVLRGA